MCDTHTIIYIIMKNLLIFPHFSSIHAENLNETKLPMFAYCPLLVYNYMWAAHVDRRIFFFFFLAMFRPELLKWCIGDEFMSMRFQCTEYRRRTLYTNTSMHFIFYRISISIFHVPEKCSPKILVFFLSPLFWQQCPDVTRRAEIMEQCKTLAKCVGHKHYNDINCPLYLIQ